MKKTLSIILTAVMVLGMFAVIPMTVSAAPEGTAIKTEAEFLAMDPAGKYYLENDITVNSTWNAGNPVSDTYADNAAFTGVLDGNGKTITQTAPLFANLQGTVKNLKTAGKLVDSTLHAGNITMWTNATVVIDNVTTGAEVPSGNTSGGMIGYAATGSNITVTNSINNANVTCNGQAGGIIGYCQDNVLVINNCVNNGNITTANYGAGIAGRFGRDKATATSGSSATITNCTNNGKVVSAKGQSGGMLGYLVGAMVIDNCVNNGEIINETAIAGGIYGSSRDTASASDIKVKNCVNNGSVTGKTRVGGIAGTLGMGTAYESFRIENCVNNGKVTNAAADGFSSNFQTGGIVGYSYGGSSADKPNGIINCVNTGEIIVDATLAADGATAQVGGITAYVNSSTWEGKNNANFGKITTSGTMDLIVLTIYNKNDADQNISGNFAVAQDGVALALAGATPAEAAAYATVATAADAIAAINTAAGADLYTLNADGTVTKKHIHTIVDIAAVAPTCTEKGAEAGKKCSTCDYVEGGKEIAATGHKFAEGKCSVCQAEDPNYVPAVTTTEGTTAGDNPTADNTTAAQVTTEPEDKGCGGFSVFAALIAIVSAAGVVIFKKKA